MTNTQRRSVCLVAVMIVAMIGMATPGPTATTAAATPDASNPSYTTATTETTVTDVEVNETGFISERSQGLTILEDFPKNGSAVYDTAGPTSNVLATSREGSIAEVQDGKELYGQHTGFAGLPVQTDEYAAHQPVLNYQQRSQPASYRENPRQELSLSWEIVADSDTDTETVRLDYDHAAEAGLQVNESATNALIDANSPASDLRGWIEYDLGDGDPTGGDSQTHFGGEGNETNDIVGVDIDNAANEIAITYRNNANASVSGVDVVLVWEPVDPVEGLDIQDDEDERIDHVFRGPAGESVVDRFQLVDTGATALVPTDRGSEDSVIGQQVSDVDLSADEQADGTMIGNGSEDTTAFHVWHEQTITFIAGSPSQRIQIYEVAEEESADGGTVYTRGDRVYNPRGLPGQAVTMNTSALTAGEQYFVTFGENRDRVAVLDVQPLALGADAPAEVNPGDDLAIDVTSSDSTGNEVEAWFLAAGDSDIGDVQHVEEAALDGTGDATLRVSPEADLDAQEGEEYYAWIVHPESETFVSTDTIAVVEDDQARVRITSPTSEDRFVRGDIVPIELAFENTDRGTLTFGDRDAHNVEINVTVRDTDGDGSGTVYLNTFQVGHGYVMSADGDGMEPNGGETADWESRNHGLFTLADSGVALEGTEGQTAVAHPGMDITGGSQGGAVMHSFAYDLSSVAGEQPFTTANQLDDRTQVAVVDRENESTELHTAPGAGVNSIDPETVDDIDSARSQGNLAPADGIMATNEVLVMELQAEGMTGVFHEAILVNDSTDLEQADLFNRDDDIITRIWHLPGEHVAWDAMAVEPAAQVPANEDQLSIELDQHRVLGDRGGDTNFVRFYLPLQMEEGENVTAGDRNLHAPQHLEASFTFRAIDATDGGSPLDDFLGETQTHTQPLRYESPVADLDPTRGQHDSETGRLEVFQQNDYVLAGITNVAAGTNLTVQINSKSGEDSAFFTQHSAVYPSYVDHQDQQRWEVTVAEAFGDAEPGTEFEIRIRRQGAAGIINPGEAIDGVVLEAPMVRTFVFPDQESQGDMIVLDEIETNHGGYIVITDADGTELGRTDRITAGIHQDVTVSLDESLDTGDHELTALVYRTATEPYPDAEQSATISIPSTPGTETDTTGTVTEATDGDGPGFGIGLAVAGLGAGFLLVRRFTTGRIL